MENFFTVILLTAVSVILFSIYYGFRGLWRKNKARKILNRIEKKNYLNEKSYVRDYIRILLLKLSAGEIGWILVSSRLYPLDTLELTVSPSNDALLIKTRLRKFDTGEIKLMKKLGITAARYDQETNLIRMPVNSRIVTDVIYYCLEIAGNQTRARNLKIITSGGYA